MRENAMKAKTSKQPSDDLLSKYDFDFPKAERGRYARQLKVEGSNLVLVESDLAKAFPDSASAYAALRSVVESAKLSAGLTQRASGRAVKWRS